MHYDQIMHRLDVGCRLLSERLKKEILEEIWVRADAPTIRHFRDGKGTGAEMWPAIVSGIATGRLVVQLLAIFFNSPRSLCDRKINSAQFPSRQIPAGCNSQSGSDNKQRLSFRLTLPRLFYFFSQYASNAQGYNIRYASKQNLYKSKVLTMYNSGKQTITYTATITQEILSDLKHLSVLNFSKKMKLRLLPE